MTIKFKFILLALSLFSSSLLFATERKKDIITGQREDFSFSGCNAFVIPPPVGIDVPKPNPWVWYAPTLGRGLPGKAERWMIQRLHKKGITIAGIDVGESYGSPKGRQLYQEFYKELTEKRGYSKKPVLLARSRGGLMLYNWAVEHPNSVGGIAGIYPVCNLLSYPGLKRACGAYGMTEQELKEKLKEHNPVNRLAPLAKTKVPIRHIHGDSDRVVPLETNSQMVADRYKALGGPVEIEVVKGQGHNMWEGWFESQKLTDFMITHALRKPNSSKKKTDTHWPQIRGPEQNGYAKSSDLPLKWSEKENVTWKATIHHRGWSSPVIWKDQIWVTTAHKDGKKLFAVCINKKTGKIIHDLPIFDVKKPQKIASINSYASPTPVVEEGRVYVHYGTYGTACIDTKSGDILWSRRDLKCDHETNAGPGSSPFLVGDHLIMNVDARDVQYVIALNKENGKRAWKSDRSVDFKKVPVNQRKAYCMPTLIPRGKDGKQIVSPGAQAIISYVPQDGKELWKVRHRGWSMAPRPIYGHGLIYVIMDYDFPELWAINPEGSGDVTDSHIVWKVKKGMPARSGPVLINDLLFTVNNDGIATCIEAKTGAIVWKKRLKGDYSASPIYNDNRIYFFNESSLCTVLEPSRKFKILATNSLGDEELRASPAVIGKTLFVRTAKHLYRIEKK